VGNAALSGVGSSRVLFLAIVKLTCEKLGGRSSLMNKEYDFSKGEIGKFFRPDTE